MANNAKLVEMPLQEGKVDFLEPVTDVKIWKVFYHIYLKNMDKWIRIPNRMGKTII
jgi:hypothetical protein